MCAIHFYSDIDSITSQNESSNVEDDGDHLLDDDNIHNRFSDNNGNNGNLYTKQKLLRQNLFRGIEDFLAIRVIRT